MSCKDVAFYFERKIDELSVQDKVRYCELPHLSEGEDTFLSPDHTALHHDKVIIHFTIVREASLQGQYNRRVRITKRK